MQTAELSDYLDAFRRRRVLFLGVAGLLVIVATLSAFFLPPKYESTAIIQIEQQEVPQDLVRSTITTFADQRVQMIGQRTRSASNLERIIDKFDLYSEELRRDGLEKVLVRMRKAIGLEMISADVMDPRSGRPVQANIAFRLSYEYANPGMAQRVANELVELYLSENQKNRTRLASETATFLAEESEKLQRRINNLENRLADFKESHVGALPEQMSLNLQLMERIDNQLLEIDREMRSLDERQVYLEAQLSQIEPGSAVFNDDGKRILAPADRLRALETEFTVVSSRYTDRHPDYRRLHSEIEKLRAELGGGGGIAYEELQRAKAALLEARQKYSDEHPDIVTLQRAVETIEAELAAKPQTPTFAPPADTPPSNPAYIQLKAQLDALLTERRSLKATRETLREKLDSLQEQLMNTPQVEREYRSISREYQSALQQYSETRARHMEAQLAESLEKGRKGERFSVIEPPRLPIEPISPNRTAIVLLGLILAIGIAGGTVILAESLDNSIHGVNALRRLVGDTMIVSVPMILTDAEVRRERLAKVSAVTGAILIVPAVFVAVHFAYRPLDVLWFKVIRKLGFV